ncbi:serine/threonine-protein kinase [Mucilaginibacter antarcticus]|uniref:serine/threonine-protein kinase n=1 Tax=Mucilaginibacter antarcticus TaxID=1855725 RepID=UPI00363DF11D
MSKIFTITEGLENMGALRTGGQGSVYKGRRIGPIITAVKLLPTPIQSENEKDKNYRNFLNEVNKLKKVNEEPNPNVVKILNSGITDSGSFPFIEMEFIEGPDLCELISTPNDKIFTLKQIVKLADQLACALAHCHKFGVNHGDVKSNNVKFNVHTGNYVLLDFGLSIMSDEQRRTSIRHAGAIEFMAPEQNEGKMLPQTDIYSYGVILFELLTGSVPFPLQDSGETSRNTVMVAHMESPVPDILELRKNNIPASWSASQKAQEVGVPQWLIDITYKCLEKLPENRFADGTQLHDAILQSSLGNMHENEAVSTETSAEPAYAITVQPGENENQPDQSNMISMSKPVFALLMLLLVGCMSYSVYALFNKPVMKSETTVVPIIDTAVKVENENSVNTANDFYDKKKG